MWHSKFFKVVEYFLNFLYTPFGCKIPALKLQVNHLFMTFCIVNSFLETMITLCDLSVLVHDWKEVQSLIRVFIRW